MITALVWSERLLALAILFQTMELLQLKQIWMDSGVWKWSQVKKGYGALPPFITQVLDFLLNEAHFHRLLQIRLASSVLVWFFHPAWIIGILFLSTWLIAIRWRGIFNGGSDSMTALIALSLWIAQGFEDHPLMVKACLAYIAIQITGSYFLAGWVKLKNYEWRSGVALSIFFKTPRYDSPPDWVKSMMDHERIAPMISWGVIIFECSFPLAWLHPQLCLIYLLMGFVFHLLNFYIFGLNRFVFAWLAGYPALYFWSQR